MMILNTKVSWESVSDADFDKGNNGSDILIIPLERGLCFWNDA